MTEYECICPVCGKKFISVRKNRIYCSDKCRCIHYSKKREITKICSICGRPFSTLNHQRKYCSEECAMISRQKKKREAVVNKKNDNIGCNDIRSCKHKDCMYRGKIDNKDCCDYLWTTGHKRGCSIANCDKYKKGRRRKTRAQISLKPEGERYA